MSKENFMTTGNTEKELSDLMEMCLNEKMYTVMKNALKLVESTYSKYTYYMERLNKAS